MSFFGRFYLDKEKDIVVEILFTHQVEKKKIDKEIEEDIEEEKEIRS